MNKKWIASLLDLTVEAGQATLPYHPAGRTHGLSEMSMGLEHKADSSPVTLADLAANDIIVQGLRRITPEIPIVSEELPDSVFVGQSARLFWLVDPLDGTREFVSGGDDFTVNIALVRDHYPVWGTVFVPVTGALYWGGLETGSFRRTGNTTDRLQVTSLDRSGSSSTDTVRVVASKSHMNAQTRSFIARFGPHVELVQAGSSLKFTMIAQGDAHAYPRLGDTSEWDTAAAQAVLEGAGGFVCDLQSNRLRYGKDNVLNPHFIASCVDPSRWLAP